MERTINLVRMVKGGMLIMAEYETQGEGHFKIKKDTFRAFDGEQTGKFIEITDILNNNERGIGVHHLMTFLVDNWCNKYNIPSNETPPQKDFDPPPRG